MSSNHTLPFQGLVHLEPFGHEYWIHTAVLLKSGDSEVPAYVEILEKKEPK